MKPHHLCLAAYLILSFASLFLTACATSDSGNYPSSDGLFQDPNEQRLGIQEDMTRITRELTIF